MDITDKLKASPPRAICEHGSIRSKCDTCDMLMYAHELSVLEQRIAALGGIARVEAIVRAYEAGFQTEVERYDWFNEHAAFEAGKRVRIVEEVGNS